MASWLNPQRSFDTPCTVDVSHRFESLGAHVALDENLPIQPGDRVLVHGSEIRVPYGQTITERRTATVTRAPWWERAWLRMIGDLGCRELIDVSFTDRRRV